jgi:hypothetical protein
MINTTSARILIASMGKAYSKAKKTGKLNLGWVALYELISYYVEFTRGQEDYNKEHLFLTSKLNTLKRNHPDVLCDYNKVAPTYITSIQVNTAPTLSDNSVDIEEVDQYQFTVADLTLDYADAETQGYKYVLINPLVGGANGTLTTDSDGLIEVTFPIIINIEGKAATDTVSLYFNRTTVTTFGVGDFFYIRVSDNPTDYLYSTQQRVDIISTVASEDSSNQPATIGDNTIYTTNRAVTVLTLAMFTTGLNPPYNDPEADLIDAIRIDEISSANVGIFYYNGSPLQVNDIITRVVLNAGLFTHEAPNQDAINSDVINFSARDEGSGIWVQ